MDIYCKTNYRGLFNTYPLYRLDGRDFIDLSEAAEEATRQFGDDWLEVYSGTARLDNPCGRVIVA